MRISKHETMLGLVVVEPSTGRGSNAFLFGKINTGCPYFTQRLSEVVIYIKKLNILNFPTLTALLVNSGNNVFSTIGLICIILFLSA
jgi:hypothetical protein